MTVVVSMHLGAFSLLQRRPVHIAVAFVISPDSKVMIVYFRYIVDNKILKILKRLNCPWSTRPWLNQNNHGQT